MVHLKTIPIFVALCGVASVSVAAIDYGNVVSGTAVDDGGTFMELTPPPPAVINNNPYNKNNLYAFDEVQNVQLNSSLLIGGLSGIGSSVTLSAGTYVSSHYILFDPSADKTMVGNIFFDTPILGVIYTTSGLNATDSTFGRAGVTYSANSGNRGLEPDDAYTIISPNQIQLNFYSGNPSDHLRVITQGVPEPSSMALSLLACVGPVWLARRRHKKSQVVDSH